ncbi:N-acylhomoserine lactone synthase [Thiocapsa imhoffii]|uniref:Acyl-homoserine-lactone synthase n=1 Tax=Thiocapsa imhoffii TaxID=382777 RepID=A0A9X1BAD9_9GAMM|nr:acyl-homoserine-lactone synthase [Thiocapsa imhoffii]MBK1646862.1 N-acylhomoserine lactone synthase [Thiocapsa imhoffii]
MEIVSVVSGAQVALPRGVYSQVSRYRQKVFVERLGWNLRVDNGEERDQFDRSDTVYVVARDAHGRVTGCARLLPTTRPYLLEEVFPRLLNGAPPPSSPEVWELSRFAAVDLNRSPTYPSHQNSSPTAVDLLKESITCAAARGAKRLITVSPIGVERLLRRAGFHAHRTGPPMVAEGHPVVVCLIETEQPAAGL